MAIATKQKPKKTTHHKRRTGTHQKRSKQFSKTYWPYLPLLLIVGIGMIFNQALSQPSILGYATNTTPSTLLADTNSERAAVRAGELSLSDKLSQAAQAKANDMVARNYWSHITPDGQEPWAFINTTGYTYHAAGENLAYGFGTSKEILTGWMNSPNHKANIINQNYTEVGFGIASSPNFQDKGPETIVVALYAKPSAQPVQAPVPVTNSGKSAEANATSQNNSGNFSVSGTVPGQVKVSRIELVSGRVSSMSTTLFAAILLILSGMLLYRHSRVWHKVITQGESFVLHHKTLDILIVSGIMMAIILLGTAGVIH